MEEKYLVYHLHTQLSSLITNIDSVNSFNDYIKRAKEYGMTALAFSEHGNVYEWKHKKDAVEKAGMKYIHAIEAYITEKPFWENEDGENVKRRDNYHCVLIAKNYEGVKEINELSSRAFKREDGHFYYNPRIFFDELLNTSKNIIITTACIGGILYKGNEEIKDKFIAFLKENKDRCFLEIQHHDVEYQKEYNKYLYELSKNTGIRLVAGTDTHCLDKIHAEARIILQRAKNTYFSEEEGWDLTFKSYQELVDAYKKQNCLPKEVYLEAINNTNVIEEMVEPFSLDTSFKYPKISDSPNETLKKDVFEDEEKIQSIINEGYKKETVEERLKEEYETIKAVDASEYILLQKHITDWCHKNDIWTGPGRGSAASSLVLYLFNVTEINPLKHGFQFWRFMHKDKYSLADIDLDYSNEDREKVLSYMLKDHLDLDNIQTAHIITFNTIALKGAIKDIGRGLGLSIQETDKISKAVHEEADGENKITVIDKEWREKYPELFKYVDVVIGTVVSMGSHPSGILVTDRDIGKEIGYCYISGNDYPVTALNMKELDSLNFVKFDVLGLDNVDIINKTCKLAGINRISAKTVDLEDDNVWNSIQNNTDLIFQVSGNFGSQTIRKIFSKESQNKIFKSLNNFTRMDLFAFTNALLRPCGKSIYNDAVNGNAHITNVKEIDNLLSSELGYPLFQETQMEFVMKFCGYSFLEADHLRKCIAEGSLITMSDGTLKPIEDVRIGDRVISFDGKVFSGKTVTAAWDNGIKDVVEVTLEDGVSLKCTPDHRLLTQDGWKESSKLSSDDWVYTPRHIMCDDDGLRSNQKLTSGQYWLIGALIGDGTLGQKWSLRFTNSDIDLINKTIEVLSDFVKNPEYSVRSVPGKEVESVYTLEILGNTRRSVCRLLEEYNLNKKAKDKRIPNEIMRMNPTEKLCQFLGGLFNTDGGYNFNRCAIEYYTISQTLIEQIRVLLQKIGIYSKISSKKVSGYDYYSYTLSIRGRDNLLAFKENVVPFIIGKKRDELSYVVEKYGDKLRTFIPQKCKQEIKDWCISHGISVRSFCLKHGVSEKSISNRYNISADIAENLSQYCLSPYTYEVLHGDFVCVPVKSVKKVGESKVYDLTVEDNHNFIANNIVCHNCIGKKLGTREELPIIKKGFEENAKKTFGLTDKESDNIINPFLQCILDATRYSFCRIHAYSYSYIGYICAYLRYYYPVEYATACLNVWQGKEEKTKEATEYCKSINIKIKEPVFRHGRPEYSSDSEHREVYKGMKSIKYLNDDCSNGLYLFRNNTYSTFSDLLYDIFHDEQCKINTKRLEILIRLDFFKEFGNSNELLYIYENFQKFKNGDAKSFSKSKTNPESILYSILKRNSTETEKTFTKLNAMNIVREIEEYIKCQNLKDIPIRKKMETQKEYLGYINLVTEKPEDRPKIIVLEKRVLVAKTGKNAGKPWCVVIDGQSIGSGKKTSYTIYYKNYLYNQFEEFDIIKIKKWSSKNGYYYIDEYVKELE